MSALPQKPLNYARVAWQSALAAALSLGLPAGLSLWLVLLRRIYTFGVLDVVSNFLQTHGLYRIYRVALTSILWSYLLGRISGYRPWWRVGVMSAVAILAVWFSPLANVDGILYEYDPSLPVHLNYAASMVGLVGGVTLFVGLAHGLILRSLRAAIVLGLSTSFVSLTALLLTIFLFDRLGFRVGTGNLAMVRVTAVNLITSALAGGAVLGVVFSRFVASSQVSGEGMDSSVLAK